MDLPQSGATGVTVNGLPIYPNEDNRGETVQQACEADRCMAHVGMGADYHYHGDPFGATCLYNAQNMVEVKAESGDTFESYNLSPLNCWKGDISGVENFWEGTHQINYDNSFTNPPYTPSARSDAQQIMPCCSSTDYYTAPGISLPLTADEMFA